MSGHGFAAVRRLADDLDVCLFGEQTSEALPRERLVVDDEDAQATSRRAPAKCRRGNDRGGGRRGRSPNVIGRV